MGVTGYSVVVDNVQDIPVAVTYSPHMSVVQSLIRSATVDRADSPAVVDGGLGKSLRSAASGGFLPGCATPIPPIRHTNVSEQVECLMSSDGVELENEIGNAFGDSPPLPWGAAATNSRQWTRSLARASMDAWRMIGPSWQQASLRLRREAERVGAAAVTGTLDTVINTLHPKLSLHNGELRLRVGCTFKAPLAKRRLAFVPMITSGSRIVADFESDDVVYIAYTMPAYQHPLPEEDRSNDTLATIVGPMKAKMLHLLRQPQTMGILARHLQCAASTATYHSQQLESAGLVERERHGQSIWLFRTRRGEEVVELLTGRRPMAS
jgi:DNA-binding transcriptional ArsR family regulator